MHMHAMRWSRQISRAATVLAVLLAGAVLYLVMRPAAVPVDTAVIARGPLKVTVEEEGKTRIKDVFVVSAPITGRVLRSPLEVGDAVEKNRTVVAAIEPSPPPFLDLRSQAELQAQIKAARAAVELARAEVAQMKAELDFAQKEYERAKSLSSRDIVSERSLEKAQTDVETRKATVARSEANLAVRERELESVSARTIRPDGDMVGQHGQACCLSVTSPVSGRVLEIYKKSEQIVLQGTPLVEIGNPLNLEVVVELLSTDAVRVREGAHATLTAWGGPDLAAVVSRVEPAGFTKVSALGIEEQRVRVLLNIERDSKIVHRAPLGHGYSTFVRITIDDVEDALLVPLGALFRHKDKWAVYVEEGDAARLKLIEIGRRNTIMAEIASGLSAGERVILHPSDRVGDGVRIVERAQGQ